LCLNITEQQRICSKEESTNFFPCGKYGAKTTYRSVGLREIVHGNGEEDVEEDVVAADEQDDEIEAEQEPETLKQIIKKVSEREIIIKILYEGNTRKQKRSVTEK
jgi:hypothetical protein